MKRTAFSQELINRLRDDLETGKQRIEVRRGGEAKCQGRAWLTSKWAEFAIRLITRFLGVPESGKKRIGVSRGKGVNRCWRAEHAPKWAGFATVLHNSVPISSRDGRKVEKGWEEMIAD